MPEWFEVKCPNCKKWFEAVSKKTRCYECGTDHTIVSSMPCCICEKTIKRKNLVAGTKTICDECKKEYRLGSRLS